MIKKSLFAAVLIFAAAILSAGKIEFSCTANKKDAIFKAGEEIVFTAKVLKDKKPILNKKLGYRFMYDAAPIKCGVADSSETLTFSVKADKPGWVSLQLFVLGDTKRDKYCIRNMHNPKIYVTANHIGGIGAMVEPEKILHSKEEPADFDAFWNKVKKELAAVPIKELERKPIPEKIVLDTKIRNHQQYNFYDVKVACAGDAPVSGYLTIPKGAKPKSLPAYVTFQGAGVFSAGLYRNKYIYSKDLIVFEINALGVPNGQPKDFYRKLSSTKYRGYPQFNKDDRDKFIFKGMYMRVMRALEYVKSLPEWNCKTLIVSGGSQGGAQALVASALDPDVTLARVLVPAMSDHFAGLSGRRPGWPQLLIPARLKNIDVKAVEKCASYYDCVYFAKRIKCQIFLATGFIDTTCPPNGVFAVYNNIPAGVKKEIYCVPTSGHSVPESKFYPIMRKHVRNAVKNQ